MRKALPGIIIILSIFHTACHKQEFHHNDSPESRNNEVSQGPLPCAMKEDVARTASAMARKSRTTTATTPVVLLLDFNGYTLQNSPWNPENSWNCPAVPAAKLTKAMKDEIFANVSEDFSAFQVIVTKNETEYASAAPDRRMRCVITHNMTGQFGNIGGTAFVSSMAWGDDTPCFVFCDPLLYNAQYISGAVSHELGHTFGLQHQARFDSGCSMLEEYHSGEGDGALSWAPIMGLSYYKSLVTWHKGTPVTGCYDIQPDAEMISETADFKSDDFADALNNSAFLLPTTGSRDGRLEQACDRDAFRKNEAGAKRIRIISAGNVDLAMEVYNMNGNLVAVHDDPGGTGLNVVINGKKYLRIRASSDQPFVPEGDGFGSYSIRISNP